MVQAGHEGREAPSADSTSELASDDFLFHIYRGSELLQDNRVQDAKDELEQALLLQPRDPKGQDLLAAVYFRLGLYPRAIKIYEQLSADNPREGPLLVNLALCYLKTGQAPAARTTLEGLVSFSPDHRRAWGYLGLAYERLGDFDKAEQAFERAGHTQMAERVAQRRARPVTGDAVSPIESAHVRRVAAAAFQELDAGELAFSLAEPAREGAPPGTWRAVELGEAARSASQPPPAPPTASHSQDASDARRLPRGLADAVRAARIAPVAGQALSVGASGLVVLCASGAGETFAARLEALRAFSGTLSTRVLERQSRAAPAEPFGGLGSPLVRLQLDGTLLLGPRAGHRFEAVRLAGDQVFLREDLVLGFELALAFENGRLPLPERDALPVVQLRGTGTVVVELLAPWVSLDVTADRGVTVSAEALVGWIGHLVPRALPPQEAPCSQRGLVHIVGEGTVLVTGR